MLAGLEAVLVSPDQLRPVPEEPAEEHATYAENAAAKAAAYAASTWLPTVADDSGLEVDALGGAPGVRSRRYFGEHAPAEERNAKLLALMAEAPQRSARFVCVVALAYPGGATETVEGIVRGEIAAAPRHRAGGAGWPARGGPPGRARASSAARPPRRRATAMKGRASGMTRSSSSVATAAPWPSCRPTR